MKNLKKYFIRYLTTFLEIFISTFILTILYYYDILANYSFSFLLFLIILLSLFFNSFLLGKSSSKKGYFEGLKLSFSFIITSLIIILFTSNFTLKILIYYLIITMTSILGSILGINKNKET